MHPDHRKEMDPHVGSDADYAEVLCEARLLQKPVGAMADEIHDEGDPEDPVEREDVLGGGRREFGAIHGLSSGCSDLHGDLRIIAQSAMNCKELDHRAFRRRTIWPAW